MILDGKLTFQGPAAVSAAGTYASDTILDVGSGGGFLFGAAWRPSYAWFRIALSADDAMTLQVDFVASDASDLDPNRNEGTLDTDVLGSTGLIAWKDDGSAKLAYAGDTIERSFPLGVQRIARQYYGFLYIVTGTNAVIAASQDAYVTRDAQTNMVGPRAAIPA